MNHRSTDPTVWWRLARITMISVTALAVVPTDAQTMPTSGPLPDHALHDMGAMSMDHDAMTAMPGMADAEPDATMTAMTGMLGAYSMSRDSSGTSWQPDSTPDDGMHFTLADWMMMAHGSVDFIDDHQGGRRGGSMAFSTSMAMLMAERPIGDDDRLGLRLMLSLEPLIGPSGYPLLFATGETADGRTPLVDRQHPHNLFMELSTSYSHAFSADSSIFLYAGLPGEPALGPSAYMHRLSGMDNPEAPITHHWLDSTHISNGVITIGAIQDGWKIEASVFNGREPDQFRYAINTPRLDSAATRLTWNPDRNWSLQASWGTLASPEQLDPTVHEQRITSSASYNLPFDGNNWATTLAWGRKNDRPGHRLDGFLLESSLRLGDQDSFFARIERAAEDDLFRSPNPLAGQIFTPGEATLGYIRDFRLARHVKVGLGGLVSRYLYANRLDAAYGNDPTSTMLFARIKLL